MQSRPQEPSAQTAEPQSSETSRIVMAASCLVVIGAIAVGLTVSTYLAISALAKNRRGAASKATVAGAPADEARLPEQTTVGRDDRTSPKADLALDIEPDQVNLDNLLTDRPLLKETHENELSAPAAGGAPNAPPPPAQPPKPSFKEPNYVQLAVAGDNYITAGPRIDPPPGVIVPGTGAANWRKAVWRFCSQRPFKCWFRIETVAAGGRQLGIWGRYCESEEGLWSQYSRFDEMVSSDGEAMPKESHILFEGKMLWISVCWTDGLTRIESHPAGRSLRWVSPVPVLDRQRIAQTFLCDEEEPAATSATSIIFPDKKRHIQLRSDSVAAMQWIEETGGRKIPYSLSVITIDETPVFGMDSFVWIPPEGAEVIMHK